MRLISGHREVCLCGLDRCVPVGGGPPARSPHASLRLGVVDLEARPGPAAAHRHLGPAPRATRASRFPPCVNPRLGVVDLEARPGPAAAHRHPPHRWGFSLLCTSHPGLAAHGHRRQAPQPGLSCPAAHALPSTPAVPGVLVVIGVVLKPGYALPPPTGTAVGHQPGAVCPALVSNLARWGCSIRSWLAACRRRVAALMMSFPPF